MEIKDLIRSKRIEKGLTMKDVAAAVGVSEGTVSRWESGNIGNMKRSRIYALSKVLGISPLLLMDDAAMELELETKPTSAVKQELHELIDSLPDDMVAMLLDVAKRIVGQ